MIEKIQKVSNPLTIIAIFAGLAEVASAIALAAVDKEVQLLLVWFIMLFPVFLGTLFFATLNLNPQVLYAPSDFQNEENFLNLLHSKRNLEASFDRLNRDLESATDNLVETVSNRLGQEAEAERQDIRQAIQRQIDELKSSVKETEQSANAISLQALPSSHLQKSIIQFLFEEEEPVTLISIAYEMDMSESAIARALHRLEARQAIRRVEDDGVTKFQVIAD